MSSDLSLIAELTPARSFWHMKCKIIKVWKQSYRWDLILLDVTGDKIQRCVKMHLLPQFERFLTEDSVVIIRNFGVADQKDRIRVIPLDLKINFFKSTTVTSVSVFEGHPFGFKFTDYCLINEQKPFEALTVDVLGRLVFCGDLNLFSSNDRNCKRLNFELQDASGNIVKCTFWDTYAELLNSFVANNVSKEMVIILIQHGRVRPWTEGNTVQNDRYATRVFINEELEEINSIRRSLILFEGSSTSQTVLSSQTVYPVRNNFLVETERKHIDELLEINEEMACVVVATVKIIEQANGWCYNACRQCQRKVVKKDVYLEQSDEIPDNFIEAPFDSLWCLKCKTMCTCPVQKYKLHLMVQDSTGSVELVMFDSEVSKIIGLKASDIKELQLNSGLLKTFPREFDVFKDRVFAFKVGVTKFNLSKKYQAFTVRKVTDDPEVIAELLANEDTIEPSSVNLGESSQIQPDSKDAVSFTDDSSVHETLKDSGASPAGKRKELSLGDDDESAQGSTTKSVKKLLIRP